MDHNMVFTIKRVRISLKNKEKNTKDRVQKNCLIKIYT